MSSARVAVLMGSVSDYDIMANTVRTLRTFGVECEVRVLSAHRSPHAVADFVSGAADRGIRVVIAGAGGAAHLAGVAAAHTRLPVIGVPLVASPLGGLDALLATVQMPGGVPVATVGIGKAGAVNAAQLAARLLALDDAELADRVEADRAAQIERVDAMNDKLRERLIEDGLA